MPNLKIQKHIVWYDDIDYTEFTILVGCNKERQEIINAEMFRFDFDDKMHTVVVEQVIDKFIILKKH